MSLSKNVVITGCNRGIGLELVKQTLERLSPQNLIATCRDPPSAKDLNELKAANVNLHVLKLDIQNTESFGAFADQVDEITGGEGVNLLINNAAVLTKPAADSIYTLDKANLMYHLEVNTVAPLFLIKALLPLLEKASKGANSAPLGIAKATILNISTKVGSIGDNSGGGMYAYRTSKTALNMGSKCLSLELKDKGILTVLMHPGWVKTEMGGEMAPLTVEGSAGGILTVVEKLGEADNGRFYQYDGQEIPW